MDVVLGGMEPMREITNEGGGEGPGCLMAVAVIGVAALAMLALGAAAMALLP